MLTKFGRFKTHISAAKLKVILKPNLPFTFEFSLYFLKFLLQIFWNCGCQMAAINLQTPDLPNQMNSAMFELNNGCGYVLKPPCMLEAQSKFDPFELDRVENVVPNSMTITIISGQMFIFLCEKRVNVYVEIDLYGLPGDSHKKMFKTRTVPSDGLNTIFIDGISNCMFRLEKVCKMFL